MISISACLFLLSTAMTVLADASTESKEPEYHKSADFDSYYEDHSNDYDAEHRRLLDLNSSTYDEDKKKYKDELYAEIQKRKLYLEKHHKHESEKDKYKADKEKYKHYKEKYKYYKQKYNYYKYHSDKDINIDYDYWATYQDYKYYKELYKYYKERKEKHKDDFYDYSYYYDYSSESTYLDFKGSMRQKLAFITMAATGEYSAVCSPFTAMVSIAILSFGAQGKTLKEMLKGIGVSSKSSIHSNFKSLLKEIQSVSGIHMASRVFIDYEYKLRSAFKDEATKAFGSCIEQIDMRDPNKVSHTINSWIKYHTNDRLNLLLRPDEIGHNTRLIIVDAIYFYGKWKYPFETVYQDEFYGNSGTRMVSMMSVKKKFYYGKSDKLGAQVIEVPYRDKDVKLLIILPYSKNGLNTLIYQMKLAPDLINSVHMSEKKIELRLPKFQIENEIDTGALYRSVGLNRMFTSGSGLQQVVKDETLIVDKALQKTYVIIEDEATVGTGGFVCSILLIVGDSLPSLEHDQHTTKKSVSKSEYTYSQADPGEKKDVFDFRFRGDMEKKFGFLCVAADSTSSTVCSPLAAVFPIGKLIFAAERPVEKELLKALGLHDRKDVFIHFKNYFLFLSTLKGVHLDVASQLFFTNTKQVELDFSDEAKDTFVTVGEYCDMTKPVETSAKINRWVRKKTHDKVIDVLKPNDIQPYYDLIVVNGVYFTGVWEKKFTDVGLGNFYTHNKEVKLPMMNSMNFFLCGSSNVLGMDIIRLPFKRSKAAFYLLLPHKKSGGQMLLNKLKQTPHLINSIEKHNLTLNITMPRFKIETELDMIWLYKRSGIKEIFRPKYGLTELVNNDTIYVDKAIQKVVFEIEAGGTTHNVPVTYVQNYSQVVQMYINHPFAFLISARKIIILVGYFNGEVDQAIRSTKVMAWPPL